MNDLFSHIDRRYAKICLYAGVTVLLTAVAAMVLYAASPVVAKAWQLICAVLEPMVYGAAFSYVMNPLVKLVSARLKKQKRFADDGSKRRSAAVVISLVLVVLMLLAIVMVFLIMITHSLSSLRWSAIHDLWGAASGDIMQVVTAAEELLESWGIINAESEANLLSAFNSAKNLVTTMLFATIFSVYFLIDGPRVSGYLARVARAVLGSRTYDPTRIIADADRVFSGYFRGQGIDALIVGVLSGIVLTAIGVPFAPLIGLLSGLGNLIPYVGGPVGFASIALMCLPSEAWLEMVLGFVAMAVVMFVDANIINPKLLSDNVEVHPILVVAALIAGGAVGGVAGMLVAVPTAAWLKIQLDRWLEKREAARGIVPAAEAPLEETDEPSA